MAALNPIYILKMPPHGKPNRKEKFVSFPDDPRSRMIKPAQKGSTCGIYALHWMVPRVGQHPASQHLKEREVEKITSKFRRAIHIIAGNPELEIKYYHEFLKKQCRLELPKATHMSIYKWLRFNIFAKSIN